MYRNKKEALPRDETLWIASHRDCNYKIPDMVKFVNRDMKSHTVPEVLQKYMGEKTIK